MNNSIREEVEELTSELVKLRTYHAGWADFEKAEDIEKALSLVEEYFSDDKFIVRKYGADQEGYRGEAFKNFKPSVYDNPKPSIVVSFADTKEPKYLLHGHLDVVQPQKSNYIAEKKDIPEDDSEARKKAHFEPHIEGDRMYGRGTSDMKLGVACLMKLMDDLGQEEEPPSVALMLVTDEEIGGFRGAGYLFRDIGYNPEFMISAEPSNIEDGFSVCYKQKGNFQLRISAEGKAGHGSRPWKGENANDKLTRWFEVYNELKDRFPDYSENKWVTTMNLGILDGGTKRTIIADSSKAELGIRFTQDYMPEDIMKDIAQIEGVETSSEDVDQIAEDLNNHVSSYQYQTINNEPMQLTDMNNTFVQKLLDIIEKTVSDEVQLIKRPDASDARFATAVGIPSVTFGPRGMNLHGENEYADLSSIVNYYKIIKNFVGN